MESPGQPDQTSRYKGKTRGHINRRLYFNVQTLLPEFLLPAVLKSKHNFSNHTHEDQLFKPHRKASLYCSSVSCDPVFPKFPNSPMQSPKIYYVCVELKTRYILINMSEIRKIKRKVKGQV